MLFRCMGRRLATDGHRWVTDCLTNGLGMGRYSPSVDGVTIGRRWAQMGRRLFDEWFSHGACTFGAWGDDWPQMGADGSQIV